MHLVIEIMKKNKNLFFGQMTEIKDFFTRKENVRMVLPVEDSVDFGTRHPFVFWSFSELEEVICALSSRPRFLSSFLLFSFSSLDSTWHRLWAFSTILLLFNGLVNRNILFLSVLCHNERINKEKIISLSKFENAMNCSCFHLSKAKLKAWAIVRVAAWA